MSTFVPKKVLGKFMHVTNERLKRTNGKSLVFFMGSGLCPYCAAERWTIVSALNNFGKWDGLVETSSADHDEKYLNIPTVSFAHAEYKRVITSNLSGEKLQTGISSHCRN